MDGKKNKEEGTMVRAGARCGFTLIELMVVIGIFLVMLSVVVANFRGTIPDRELTETARRFASEVEAMRAAASTGDPRYPDAVLFGVRADLDAADRYFRFRAVSLIEQPQDIDEVLLPERVSIDAIVPTTERAVFVGFLAPRGQVLFGQDIPEIAVTFRHEQTAMTKTVRVNGISGRVDLE